jgi:hypothetical protein
MGLVHKLGMFIAGRADWRTMTEYLHADIRTAGDELLSNAGRPSCSAFDVWMKEILKSFKAVDTK